MNAKLNGLALGVSVVALLVASLGSTYMITQAPKMSAGAPEMGTGVPGDLARSTEVIRIRMDDLERQNVALRAELSTTRTRLQNIESVYTSTEDQLETVTSDLAELKESSAANERAVFSFGRTVSAARRILEKAGAELDEESEEEESDEEPKLEDFLSIYLEPINGLPGPHIIVEGANLHVRSGGGATDDLGGPLFGLGNIVIGYNELDPSQLRARTGSHNLVIGSGHGYSSFGGLLAGLSNAVNAPNSSVTGGTGNEANGWASSVTGGQGNLATRDFSSVTGGIDNSAVAKYASVSGGAGNEAGGWASSVTGGRRNLAIGDSSTVTGGLYNRTTSDTCTISGGTGITLDGRDEGYWMVGALKSNPEM